MVFSVLTRKGKIPKHNFHPPRSQSWLRGGRSQLAAPSGPGSHTLPIPEGTRHPTQLVLSLLRSPKRGDQFSQVRQTALLLGHRDRERGEVHCSLRPGPWLVGGLGEGSGALQDIVPSLFPGPSSSPAGSRLSEQRVSRRRPESASYFKLHLTPTTPVTFSSITSPVVPHWQLLVSRVHCGADQ